MNNINPYGVNDEWVNKEDENKFHKVWTPERINEYVKKSRLVTQRINEKKSKRK